MKSSIGRLGRAFLTYGVKVIVLLLAVSMIAFALVSAAPLYPAEQYAMGAGSVSPDQRAEIEAYWGVGTPPVERYFTWLSKLLQGDLGESALYRRPVSDLIGERFLNSLALMGFAWGISGIMGFGLGCIMGTCRGKWPDRFLKNLCYLLSSVPAFWLGMVLLLVFSVLLGWFPIGFSSPIGVPSEDVVIWQRLHHLVLPSFTLSLISFPSIALHTRQKLIGVMNSEYALFARARGEGRWTLLRRHGVRNILLPALTLQFASFSELFGGSILAETVFSYPGLGSAISAAGLNADIPLLLGTTLFSSLFVCAGNMAANLLYEIVDPQLRGGGR